ncbi:MAG TPA: tetratricopeptide repeat protein [Vicinamibacterales bacterium]|nr:tetratricopeptide repeat protein [Vicinamibacterales bacterium]
MPLVIFAVAFAVRLAHVWQIRRSPFFDVLLGDARGYDAWAQQIAAGDWIGRDVFYQAPLYPYFLGILYAVGGRSLLAVRVVQAAIGAGSCALLADAGRRLFSKAAGIAAGLILALYAPAIFFDGLIQKSVLDVFFVSLALWLIARIRGHENKDFLPLGLAIGALALTRENALVFVVVLAVWALMRNIRTAAAFAAGVAIVLVPVGVRNSRMPNGGFFVTTSQFGPNLYIGNHPGADGTYQSLRYGRGAPEFERQDATELAERASGRTLTPGEVSSYWTDRALDFVTSRPGEWLKLMARKAALLGNATEIVDTEGQSSYADWSLPLRVLSPIGTFGILLPLSVIGVFATWGDRRRLAVLYALALAYAASVIVFYVFARYRYPLVPFATLFAAVGIVRVARSAPGLSRAALATAVAVAVFANWPIVSAQSMRAVTELNLGTALQADHRLDDAIVHYRRSIDLSPDYAPAYSDLATALRQKGRNQDALRAYRDALRLQPSFAAAHYNLANLLLDAGDAGAAIPEFEQAIAGEPASADAHNNLGLALIQAGRIDEAIAHFRQAAALDPQSAMALRNLGDALSAKGDESAALDALRRASLLDPNDSAVRYDLASALLEAGRLDEAIAEFRTTLKIAPQMAEAHNNLGIALGSQGKMDEAIDEFRKALAVKEDFPDAQRNLETALHARHRG